MLAACDRPYKKHPDLSLHAAGHHSVFPGGFGCEENFGSEPSIRRLSGAGQNSVCGICHLQPWSSKELYPNKQIAKRGHK